MRQRDELLRHGFHGYDDLRDLKDHRDADSMEIQNPSHELLEPDLGDHLGGSLLPILDGSLLPILLGSAALEDGTHRDGALKQTAPNRLFVVGLY